MTSEVTPQPHQQYLATQTREVWPQKMAHILQGLRTLPRDDFYGSFCHAEAALELATTTQNGVLSEQLLDEADEQYAVATAVAARTNRTIHGLKVATRHQFLPRYRQVYQGGGQALDAATEGVVWHGLVDSIQGLDLERAFDENGGVAVSEVVFHSLLARHASLHPATEQLQSWPSFLRQATRSKGGRDSTVWNAGITTNRPEYMQKIRIATTSQTGRDRNATAAEMVQLPRVGLVEALGLRSTDDIIRVAHALQQERADAQNSYKYTRYGADEVARVLSAKLDGYTSSLLGLLGKVAQLRRA